MEKEQKHTRSMCNVLSAGVPGARQQVMIVFGVVSIFLAAAAGSGFLFIKAIQIGRYAESVLRAEFLLIAGIWATIWCIAFFVAARAALRFTYRVAGPINRLEQLLGEILDGKDRKVSVRQGDELEGVARRLNRLLESQKTDVWEGQQLRARYSGDGRAGGRKS